MFGEGVETVGWEEMGERVGEEVGLHEERRKASVQDRRRQEREDQVTGTYDD